MYYVAKRAKLSWQPLRGLAGWPQASFLLGRTVSLFPYDEPSEEETESFSECLVATQLPERGLIIQVDFRPPSLSHSLTALQSRWSH